MKRTTYKSTTYTIVELKEMIGGEAYKRALEFIREQTGITDEERAIMEAEEFHQIFTKNGNPTH